MREPEGGGRERTRKLERENQRGRIMALQTSDLKPNPPPLPCHLLQLGQLLEWIQQVQVGGEFLDESEVNGQMIFEPRCPTSKNDLLALTALRFRCNISGDERRERQHAQILTALGIGL
jgi:hypothetical protein